MTDATFIHQYRLYCIEEDTFVYVWSAVEPTLCPNDHPDRTIDPTKTLIVQTSGNNFVFASQDVYKNFQHTSVPLTIPTMTIGDVYTQNFSWPMDIQIWKTEFYTTADHIGDYLTIYIAPGTVIGLLTQNAAISDTTIEVSSTVVTNQLISKGVDLALFDGVTETALGRVTSFDTTLNTVTFETPLSVAYSIGAFVRIYYKAINNILLHRLDDVYKIGEKGLKGRPVPANTTLQAHYTNNTGAAKDLIIVLELYYQ
jgi:hypothetical protein